MRCPRNHAPAIIAVGLQGDRLRVLGPRVRRDRARAALVGRPVAALEPGARRPAARARAARLAAQRGDGRARPAVPRRPRRAAKRGRRSRASSSPASSLLLPQAAQATTITQDAPGSFVVEGCCWHPASRAEAARGGGPFLIAATPVTTWSPISASDRADSFISRRATPAKLSRRPLAGDDLQLAAVVPGVCARGSTIAPLWGAPGSGAFLGAAPARDFERLGVPAGTPLGRARPRWCCAVHAAACASDESSPRAWRSLVGAHVRAHVLARDAAAAPVLADIAVVVKLRAPRASARAAAAGGSARSEHGPRRRSWTANVHREHRGRSFPASDQFSDPDNGARGSTKLTCAICLDARRRRPCGCGFGGACRRRVEARHSPDRHAPPPHLERRATARGARARCRQTRTCAQTS